MAFKFHDNVLKEMTPKESRKASKVIQAAKKLPDDSENIEVVKKDGSVKTWAELGEELGIPEWKNIPEPPPTPGYHPSEREFDQMCNRSQKASDLEQAGKVEQALKQYDLNISKNSILPGDYSRPSMIYAKRGDLEKAVYYIELGLRSPACTNPAQDNARRDFRERRNKLVAKLKAKQDKQGGRFRSGES